MQTYILRRSRISGSGCSLYLPPADARASDLRTIFFFSPAREQQMLLLPRKEELDILQRAGYLKFCATRIMTCAPLLR